MTGTAHLGEAGLLARMLPQLAVDPRTEVGPGDDSAVIELASSQLVISTDAVVEGYDFLRTTTTARWLGARIAVQNLADVAAMGVRPQALVVALSAPHDEDPAVFVGITEGCARRAEADGASIVGGDLGRSDALTATVTAVGALEPGQEPVRRSGARPGDVLAIGSEQLGRSAAGLALVLSGRVSMNFAAGEDPDIRIDGLDGADGLDGFARELLTWHDAPDPDLSLGWTVGRSAHAMIDLSDGLVRDAGRIAAASGVLVDLDRSALEADVAHLAPMAQHLDADPWQWVLHGAEEHAMLAAFPPEAVPESFRPLGRVRSADGHPGVLLSGAAVPVGGFDHFS